MELVCETIERKRYDRICIYAKRNSRYCKFNFIDPLFYFACLSSIRYMTGLDQNHGKGIHPLLKKTEAQDLERGLDQSKNENNNMLETCSEGKINIQII